MFRLFWQFILVIAHVKLIFIYIINADFFLDHVNCPERVYQHWQWRGQQTTTGFSLTNQIHITFTANARRFPLVSNSVGGVVKTEKSVYVHYRSVHLQENHKMSRHRQNLLQKPPLAPSWGRHLPAFLLKHLSAERRVKTSVKQRENGRLATFWPTAFSYYTILCD